jgi:uncharacterized protein
MSLLRLILIGIVLWLVWRALAASKGRRAPPARRRTAVGHMLRCEHCGLFVPAEEAVREGGRVFCSEEHRRQAGTGEDP